MQPLGQEPRASFPYVPKNLKDGRQGNGSVSNSSTNRKSAEGKLF